MRKNILYRSWLFPKKKESKKYSKEKTTKWFAISGAIVGVGVALSAVGLHWKKKYRDTTISFAPTGLDVVF